jgi:hypothetical protein
VRKLLGLDEQGDAGGVSGNVWDIGESNNARDEVGGQ